MCVCVLYLQRERFMYVCIHIFKEKDIKIVFFYWIRHIIR